MDRSGGSGNVTMPRMRCFRANCVSFQNRRGRRRRAEILARLCLVTSEVIVLVQPAYSGEAGSVPSSGAAAYPPSYSWAGGYIGVQAGETWSDVVFRISPLPSNPKMPIEDSSPSLGVYAGYNFQFGRLVTGVEADFAKTWLKSQPVYYSSGSEVTHTEFDWNASIRGRIGYAFGNFMPYLAGGVTVADFHLPFAVVGFGNPEHDDARLRVGWTAGAGLEYAIAHNLIVRGEYRYSDFGEQFKVLRYDTVGARRADTSITFQEVRGGLAYKFDEAPSRSMDRALSFSSAQPVAWNGFHAGVMAGYDWSQSRYIGLAGYNSYVPLNPSGWVPWLYAGYDFQFGRTVLGVEGDFMLSALRGSGDLIDRQDVVHSDFRVTSKLSNAWSVRARLGFAWGNFLPYLTAGVAQGDYSHTIHTLSQNARQRIFTEIFTSWTAGAGLEYALSDHVRLRTEYRFTPYGQAMQRGTLPNTVDLSVQEVRAGIGFRF